MTRALVELHNASRASVGRRPPHSGAQPTQRQGGKPCLVRHFTAAVKGVNFFRFSLHNTHRADSVVSLKKNDECVVSVGDSNDMGSNAAVLPLEVGDTVYVQLWANKQVYDEEKTYNSFTGFLLFTN